MTHHDFKRSINEAKTLAEHGLTGTLWPIAQNALIDGGVISAAAGVAGAALPLPETLRAVLVLTIFGFGSWWTTRRHKHDHLRHSALVTALLITVLTLVLALEGFPAEIIVMMGLAGFLASFFGYRQAF